MAVPSYTEDLTDIDLAESGSTGTAVNFDGGGGGAPAFGVDLGMQGPGCWDRQVSSKERGIVFNQTPGTGTVAAGVHIFQWLFVATPGITDVLATRGAYVCIGTGTGALVQFHVEGSDTYGAEGRVGKCYPIDYVTSANTGSVPYRTVTGSPGATPTYFGAGIKTTGSAKGSNLGVDACRYGTGAYLTAGELVSAGDASNNPCTFGGFATQNDASSNRWGILTFVSGSYELQGTFAIGQNNAGTATLCRFSDTDSNIVVVDTVHSATNFTKIIVDHASTRCELTNINITALGTNNPGEFSVVSNNPTVIINGGTWTDIGTVVFRSNTTANGTTFRRTDLITSNGSDLTNCIFDASKAASAITVANLNEVTGSSFTMGATGHAVELTGAAASYTWDNTATGYDTGSSGNGVEVTGGSITGDETIHITATTGTFTIPVATGATLPSVSSAGAIVNVTLSPVTTLVTVVTSTGTAIQNARVLLEASAGGPLTVGTDIIDGVTDVNGEISDSRTLASNQPVIGKARKSSGSPYYKSSSIIGTINSSTGASFTAVMILDE